MKNEKNNLSTHGFFMVFSLLCACGAGHYSTEEWDKSLFQQYLTLNQISYPENPQHAVILIFEKGKIGWTSVNNAKHYRAGGRYLVYYLSFDPSRVMMLDDPRINANYLR